MSSQAPWQEDDVAPWEVDDVQGDAEATQASPQDPPAAPPKPLSAWEQIQQLSSRGVYEGGQALKGFAKEAPLVALRAARMPQDIIEGAMSGAVDRLGSPKLQALDIERARRAYELRQKFEAPFRDEGGEGPGSAVGRMAAQAAPQLGIAALTSGASIPAQSLVGGASQGAQSLSEGASPTRAALSAGLAALAPGAGRLVTKVGTGLRKAAVEQFMKALNPTRIGTKATAQKIVPELLERGVTGDLESMAARGAAESKTLGRALEGRYAAAGKAGTTINATQLADSLDSLKAPFMVKPTGSTSVAMGPTRPDVAANPGAIEAIEGVQNSLRELGDAVQPDQLWKFRQNVDDIVKATNGFTRELPRGRLASIARDARTAIQKELTAKVPNVSRLNSEYALWQGLEDVAKATMARKVGQQGIGNMLARGAGLAAGAVSGGVATGGMGAAMTALAGQELAARLAALVSGPTWRTVSAVQKAQLANLLTSGRPEAAVNFIGRLTASVTGAPPGRR